MNHQTRDITGNLVYKPSIGVAKNGNKFATVIVAVAIRLIKVDGTVDQRSEYYLANIWGDTQVDACARGNAGDDFRIMGTPQIREKLMENGQIQENLELTNLSVWMSHDIANRKTPTIEGATATMTPAGSIAPPDPSGSSPSIADEPF